LGPTLWPVLWAIVRGAGHVIHASLECILCSPLSVLVQSLPYADRPSLSASPPTTMSLSPDEAFMEWWDAMVLKIRVGTCNLSRSELIQRVLLDSQDTPNTVQMAFETHRKAGRYLETLYSAEHGFWQIPIQRVDGRSISDIVSFMDSVVGGLPTGLQWHRAGTNTATLQFASKANIFVLAFDDEVQAVRTAVETIARADRRLYVAVLNFHRALGSVTFSIIQRRGILAHNFDIDKDPYLFIRVILYLFCCDFHRLGVDPTIRYCPESQATFIRVGRTEYRVLQHLGVIDGKFIRGTTCWKVQAPSGQIAFMKDWWHRNGSGFPKETVTLWKARHVPNIPKYVESDIIHRSSHFVNTHPLQKSAERIRMVSSPFALSLENFQSRKELVGVFTDIATGK